MMLLPLILLLCGLLLQEQGPVVEGPADSALVDHAGGTGLPPVDSTLARAVPGALVIAGGGELPESVRRRFVQRAGGEEAHLVIVPTASASAGSGHDDQYTEPWKKWKPASVVVLHTQDRVEAGDPEFLAPLRAATGVWFSGGQQHRIADAYVGTTFEHELSGVLRRGGVIGGTSAGAAIQSRVMITGGREHATLGQGFDLLPGAVIDQHFLKWNRANRLIGVLADHPGLFGLGIDENTAVLVEGRLMEVLGESYASLVWPDSENRPLRMDVLREGLTADLLATSRAAVARAHAAFPAAEPVPPVVPHGSLVLAGGGDLPDVIFDRFVELAGGPEGTFVVVPTAMGEDTDPNPFDADRLRRAGAGDVHVLHAPVPEGVSKQPALAALRHADGVWFTGGRQWRLVDVYRHTEAYDLFHDVLRRGGCIGGTSAGASIQAGYLLRGHPLGNKVMMAEGYERGFDFLPGVAVDQHFSQRDRFADLESVADAFPQLLCLGLDESTAAVVQGQRMEVIGDHRVCVYDRRFRPQEEYEPLAAGQAYDLVEGRRLD